MSNKMNNQNTKKEVNKVKIAKYNYRPVAEVRQHNDVFFFRLNDQDYMLRASTWEDCRDYGIRTQHTLVKVTKKIENSKQGGMSMKRIIFTAALTVLLGLGIQNMITKEEPVYTGEYRTHIIRQGETIWTIANRVCENTPGEQNLQSVVSKIIKDNNIDNTGNLQIGQEIKIRIDWEEVK